MSILKKPSAWEIVYSIAMALTCLISYTLMTALSNVGKNPADAWEQPLLRLFDTVVGVAIGVAGKWIASFAFYKARGEPVQ
jgi:hypothetical protein